MWLGCFLKEEFSEARGWGADDPWRELRMTPKPIILGQRKSSDNSLTQSGVKYGGPFLRFLGTLMLGEIVWRRGEQGVLFSLQLRKQKSGYVIQIIPLDTAASQNSVKQVSHSLDGPGNSRFSHTLQLCISDPQSEVVVRIAQLILLSEETNNSAFIRRAPVGAQEETTEGWNQAGWLEELMTPFAALSKTPDAISTEKSKPGSTEKPGLQINTCHYSSININVSIKVNRNINSKGKSKSQPELPVSVFGYVGTYTFTLESWHQLGEEIMMSGECFKKRKDSCFPASARDSETIQEMSVVLQSGVHETEKMETQAQTEDSRDDFPKKLPSLVHFFPSSTDSDSTLPCSRSFSDEILLSYCLSSPQVSGATISTIGPKPLQPALGTHSNSETSLGLNIIKIPKKHSIPVLAGEPAVIGEGEDYFLSLFGDTRKLVRSFHEKSWKHFSMILEEVGQSRSSALGDIKIAEVNVKGLFVKLINSSPDKEMEIGNHTLQQNVDGQTISLYRFLPGIIMQANSTVT
ncbi:hypothetical protein JEQ12_014860, partial [Ovis aries]